MFEAVFDYMYEDRNYSRRTSFLIRMEGATQTGPLTSPRARASLHIIVQRDMRADQHFYNAVGMSTTCRGTNAAIQRSADDTSKLNDYPRSISVAVHVVRDEYT